MRELSVSKVENNINVIEAKSFCNAATHRNKSVNFRSVKFCLQHCT